MHNQVFVITSQDEKKKKLETILRNRTCDALTHDELLMCELGISLLKQYTITVHTDPKAFQEALVLKRIDGRSDYGRILFGQALFGIWQDGSGCTRGSLYQENNSAAAVIVQRDAACPDDSPLHEIHIYIPDNCAGKGTETKHGQREEAQNRA